MPTTISATSSPKGETRETPPEKAVCRLPSPVSSRPLTHSPIHPPTHSPTHPLTHSPTHPLTHSPHQKPRMFDQLMIQPSHRTMMPSSPAALCVSSKASYRAASVLGRIREKAPMRFGLRQAEPPSINSQPTEYACVA
ncbi:Spectrin repeat superfamily Extracellular matrix-binding protein [Venturia nashicola]|uniref:Spectrin repeat superfamily Extracellular matrix-binding protein n=1 Tax=Venturia nashicola TaxID=86259 RepID=A0A4Z1PAA2_9PEZI|nr:Spectrin repeat superfamily Extracellular matrix-binding protein [Venturia nashicola]TLD37400.1 Spectrin repeat superfamily Extracellular matrix-binding protein [Venturia nashicola]